MEYKVAALHEGATRDPCKIIWVYDTTEKSMKLCGMLIVKNWTEEASITRIETRSILDRDSLYKYHCLPLNFSFVNRDCPYDQYSDFTVDALHISHLWISLNWEDVLSHIHHCFWPQKLLTGAIWTKYLKLVSSYKDSFLNEKNISLVSYTRTTT